MEAELEGPGSVLESARVGLRGWHCEIPCSENASLQGRG